MEAAVIGRLLEIFEGPEAMAPWSPPPCPDPLHELLPWRAWDEGTELYVNAASHGFVLELPPFAGIDAETLGALAGVMADAAPERCTIQFIHWASPRFGAPLAWPGGLRGEARGASFRRWPNGGNAVRPRRLAGAARRRPPVYLLGLQGVPRRVSDGSTGAGVGDGTGGVSPRARRHAGVGGCARAPAAAGRTAVAGGRTDRPENGEK